MSQRNSGVTLIELLIAMAVGAIIIGSAFALVMGNRQLLAADQARTSMNQNLRSALDILGADVRVSGERLGSAGVPAIAVRNGNELILRRAIIEDVLPSCSGSDWHSRAMLVGHGSNNQDPAFPECAIDSVRDKNNDGVPDDLIEWLRERNKPENGGRIQAYIYNRTHDYGEFFTYTREFSFGSNGFGIVRDGSWQNDYLMGEQNNLYLLEERRYRLTDEGVLELIINNDEDAAQRIVNGLEGFTLSAILDDGTEKATFGSEAGDDWKDLSAIKVEIEGDGGRTLSSQFFPRNALSR